MSSQAKTYLKFGGATAFILVLLAYLAYTGVQDSKSYYVTIKELHKMGDGAYTKRLRVAGNVQPGSIKRSGTHIHRAQKRIAKKMVGVLPREPGDTANSIKRPVSSMVGHK